VTEPVFFFIYNTDNYFHFLYDALPVLSQYFRLPEPRPKLLMSPRHWYPFVMDSLHLLGISSTDILPAKPTTEYRSVLVASSPTHEGFSNDPPHASIWSIYDRMRVAAGSPTKALPRKIYVSRRSWVHGDTSNLGTNYTTRRKMLCEDDLVASLDRRGYTEVFCETMSMQEKVQMFAEATHVVGAIGGGMCNLVFSRPECVVTCIASPEFERINHRFLYTMNHTQYTMFRNTWPTSMLYRRARVGTDIGEIIAEDDDTFRLAIGNGVTWSADAVDIPTVTIPREGVVFLDEGLNSPWNFDEAECMKYIK
jgi:capsular polysaccharide biosynthesis protein